MTFFEGYVCGSCGNVVEPRARVGECPLCAGPLLASYDIARARTSLRRDDFFRPAPGVWRFKDLLPDFAEKVSLGEGNTPLVAAPRLAAAVGVPNLSIKDESFNPTGSFKARGMAVAVSRLVTLGITEGWIPSAGNAGLALAAYGAASGVRSRVYIPTETPEGVAEECRFYGALVTVVPGILPDAARQLEADIGRDRSGHVGTFREPGRVEGKKTMAFELEAEARPEWVVFPTGGGTGVVAIWKAYREMAELGWLDREPPRIALVQAAGCAPLVKAFIEGSTRAAPWSEPVTIASGIRVPASRADAIILRALRETRGAAASVSDDEIIEAAGELARLAGIFACPEGAAAWAGTKKLLEAGTMSPSSRIVVFNTGGGARYRFLLDPFKS